MWKQTETCRNQSGTQELRALSRFPDFHILSSSPASGSPTSESPNMTSSSLPVAILAGGMATRLRPITEKIPKLLVEVAGEPFFSHQIRLLKKNGLTRIVLCVGYLGDMIVQQYGDGSRWGVQNDYAFDGPK